MAARQRSLAARLPAMLAITANRCVGAGGNGAVMQQAIMCLSKEDEVRQINVGLSVFWQGIVVVRGSIANSFQQRNNSDDDTVEKEQQHTRSRASSPTRAHKQGSTHGDLPPCLPTSSLTKLQPHTHAPTLEDALPPVIDRAISALVPGQKTVSPLHRPFPVSL